MKLRTFVSFFYIPQHEDPTSFTDAEYSLTFIDLQVMLKMSTASGRKGPPGDGGKG
jgi:hypothetical protein